MPDQPDHDVSYDPYDPASRPPRLSYARLPVAPRGDPHDGAYSSPPPAGDRFPPPRFGDHASRTPGPDHGGLATSPWRHADGANGDARAVPTAYPGAYAPPTGGVDVEDDEPGHPIRALGSALIFAAIAYGFQTPFWRDLVGEAGEGRNSVRKGAGLVGLLGDVPPVALSAVAGAVAILLVVLAVGDARRHHR